MSYKKKILSFVLVSLMFISVGCSKAEGEVKEDVKVEVTEKSLEDMSDEEFIKHIATQYAGYSIEAMQREITDVIVYEDYVDAEPYKFEGLIDDEVLAEDFSDDMLEVLTSVGSVFSYMEANSLNLEEAKADKSYQEAIQSIDAFIQKYIPEYTDSFLDKEKQYIAENPVQEKPIADFANVSVKEDDYGYTFIGEIVNNNPIQTLSGFGEVALYNGDVLVDTLSIVITDTPPNDKSTFQTLPIKADFTKYEMKITSPLWAE